MYRTFAVRVSALERISPHFVRVTVGGDDLVHIGRCGRDQRINVVFPTIDGFGSFPWGDDWYHQWRLLPAQARNPIRTYTVRRIDRTARRLAVDYVAHGDCVPASRWVMRAEVGDELIIVAPDAAANGDPGGYEWRPGSARTLLIAGDVTATPAVSAIVESLPVDAQGAVFLEVPAAADALPLTVPGGITLRWLPRNGAGYGEPLGQAVRSWAQAWQQRHGIGGGRTEQVPPDDDSADIWDVPAGLDDSRLYAWLAAEAGAITGLRRYLVGELGIDRSRVAFMGYWRQGQAEA